MSVFILFLAVFFVISKGQLVPTAKPCRDAQPDCDKYDDPACRGIYESWARDKCAKRCGYCGTPPPPTPKPPCKDKLTNCQEFQSDTCNNPFYRKWAEHNCRKFCRFCVINSNPGMPTPMPIHLG